MMRRALPIILCLCTLPLPLLAAEQPLTVTLFDFEGGVSDWRANPWSGGRGFVEPAPEAHFGSGALLARYVEIPRGCNMISPLLPEQALWRDGDYDRLCLWVKGDGSKSYLSVVLASEAGDLSPTFSGRVPLDSKQWRRFCLKFNTLWNREDKTFNLHEFKRIYFGATGTHEVAIDQVQLMRPARAVPLKPKDNPGPAPMLPELYANPEGSYLLTFDPKLIGEPTLTAEVTVQWPEKKPRQLMKTLPAQQATEELWLTLPGMPDASGEGRFTLVLKEADGERCYLGEFTFPVALAAIALPTTRLQLIPRPKEIIYHPTLLKLPRALQGTVLSRQPVAQVGLKDLQADFKSLLGREISFRPLKLQELRAAVVVITPDADEISLPEEVRDRLPKLREQGYLLHLSSSEIVLAALNEAGMRNGAATLRQIIRSSCASAEGAQLPGLTILDWPALPLRAMSLGLPTTRWGYPNDAPVPLDFWLEFLQRSVVDQKINCIGIEVLQGMKFDRHPEIAGPSAWSKEDVRRAVQFLRDRGVEVFPIVNSLGHGNWLAIPRPEFREDGDPNTLCTRHPDLRHVLTDVYDECLEVFGPRYFHFGLDEIRWQTANVPAEKRCPRCAGADKRELFVEHVRWLAEYARSRDLRMLMWADMIIPEHNGGAPYYLAETVGRLPREITLCDWSVTLAPLSLWDLHERGFTVWKANSRGVNNAQLPLVESNMWGCWSRVPWLTESCWNALEYSYLNQLVAAEYSWNVYPDLMADGVPLKAEWLAARSAVQQRLAGEVLPNSGAKVTALAPGQETLKLAGLQLQPFAAPAVETRALGVAQPVSALYALLAADLPADQRKSFAEEFKKKEHWRGVPIGQLVLEYEGGEKAPLPLLYGYHLRAPEVADPFPQAYGALATTPVQVTGTQRVAYLVQFTNPHPERMVAEVRFEPGTMAAKPLLLAASVRSVWREE